MASDASNRPPRVSIERLSARQQEVLELLSKGLTNDGWDTRYDEPEAAGTVTG